MAGMVVHYGDYSFTPGEPIITIDKSQVYSQRGQKSIRTETVNITGQLIQTDKTAFNSAITALEAAFSQDGKDFKLKYPDNSTIAYEIDSSATRTGTKVTAQPSYPTGDGPEFADNGVRTYSISITADYDVDPDGTDSITNYSETIQQWGGLALYQHAVVVNGVPQNFKTADKTHYYLQQTGTATGKSSYPDVPADAGTVNAPDLVKVEDRTTRISPSEHFSNDGTNLQHESYSVSWNKSFVSVDAFDDGTAVLPGEWP
jgi:hypothetical protein